MVELIGKVPELVEACAVVVMSFPPLVHHTEGVGPGHPGSLLHLPTR